jgi:hypothetical protein
MLDPCTVPMRLPSVEVLLPSPFSDPNQASPRTACLTILIRRARSSSEARELSRDRRLESQHPYGLRVEFGECSKPVHYGEPAQFPSVFPPRV